MIEPKVILMFVGHSAGVGDLLRASASWRGKGMVVEFEEGKYGMLMMVLCDREGRVYDVWIPFGT